MIFNIRKWRHNKKRTGFVLELSYYDEERDEWRNALAHVPRADAYAGKNEDELPACLGAVMKDGCLCVKCRIFDDYVPKDKPEKPQTAPDWEDAESPPSPPAKKNAKKKTRLERMDDNGDIPF